MNPARWITLGLLAVALGYEAVAFASRRRLPTLSADQWAIQRRHPWYRWAVLALGLAVWWHWFEGFGLTVWGYEL